MWMATPYCCIIVTQIAYICMCVWHVYMYVCVCVYNCLNKMKFGS